MSSDTTPFGFGKFVPGFDFLQSLAGSAVKGAAGASPLPHLANWVAPTLSVEELDKRISELKAVQFWLDQNATGLKATIQALEVQKMTLAALKGMNFQLGEVAEAFKIKPAAESAPEAAAEAPPQAEAAARPAPKKRPKAKAAEPADGPASEGVVDPLQWWGALTQQFQHIAASAMQDAATQKAFDTTRQMASGLAQDAFKTASDMASSVAQAASPKARAAEAGADPSAAKPVARPARKRAPRRV